MNLLLWQIAEGATIVGGVTLVLVSIWVITGRKPTYLLGLALGALLGLFAGRWKDKG